MKINNLIGISGSINSGKDLVGEMIVYIHSTIDPTFDGFNDYTESLFETNVQIKKCADKLKDIVAIVIGCTRKDLEDELFKNKPLGKEWECYNLKNELITQADYDKLSANQKIHAKKVELTPRKILQLFGTNGGRRVVHPNIWVNSLFSDYRPLNKGYAHNLEDLSELYFCGECKNCNTEFSGFKRQSLCKNCIEDDSIQFYPKWVITDVRFPNNEGQAITERNGLLIGLKRKFSLKFPQYAELELLDPYEIPMALIDINPELYNSLTHESETSMGDYSWCDTIIENDGTIEELFDEVLRSVVKNVMKVI